MSTTRVRAAAIAAAVLVALAGCGSETEGEVHNLDNPTTTAAAPSVAVQARIQEEMLSLMDCPEVQATIDQALDNAERYPAGDSRRQIPLAYAEAGQARLEDLGCV